MVSVLKSKHQEEEQKSSLQNLKWVRGMLSVRGHPSTPASTANEKAIHSHHGDILLFGSVLAYVCNRKNKQYTEHGSACKRNSTLRVTPADFKMHGYK